MRMMAQQQKATRDGVNNGRNILAEIVAYKRLELKQQGLLDTDIVGGFERSQAFGPVRDFTAALARTGSRFIFECKRQSPTLGTLRSGDIGDFIKCYEGIADAISVLTDSQYFGGSLADLRCARMATNSPLLRKDFIIDPVQVAQAYAHGADAVLLMLSVLDDAMYRRCAQTAHSLGLHILTEVHTAEEMRRACALDAKIIGINNRDLRSLHIDLEVTRTLRPLMSGARLCISESGIRTHKDVQALVPLVDGFLVGSSLMQAERIDLAARELAFGAVKICGLTQAADAQAAYTQGAVFGGLIFAQASKRRIDVAKAQNIIAAAPLNYVGVFVEQSVDDIIATAEALNLAAVQLHGTYSPADIAELEQHLPVTVETWPVHKVGASTTRLPYYAYAGIDDKVTQHRRRDLYDYAGAQDGGNGQCFDWGLLTQHPHRNDVVLAGGITPHNVGRARRSGAGVLDVNSGVESLPGGKDAQKIAELFTALRQSYTDKESSGNVL